TGAPTYQKDSEVALMYAHLLEPPPQVTHKRSDLPPEIDGVVAKAMAKSPSDRYATAPEFAAAMRKALTGTESGRSQHAAQQARIRATVAAGGVPPAAPTPSSAAHETPPPPAAQAPPPAAAASDALPSRRKPWMVPVAIVILLLIIGGIVGTVL